MDKNKMSEFHVHCARLLHLSAGHGFHQVLDGSKKETTEEDKSYRNAAPPVDKIRPEALVEKFDQSGMRKFRLPQVVWQRKSWQAQDQLRLGREAGGPHLDVSSFGVEKDMRVGHEDLGGGGWFARSGIGWPRRSACSGLQEHEQRHVVPQAVLVHHNCVRHHQLEPVLLPVAQTMNL